MIKLGQKVRDIITGLEGVMTGRAEYLFGCVHLAVLPTIDEKGSHRGAEWIDEPQLEEVLPRTVETETLQRRAAAAVLAGDRSDPTPSDTF